MRLRLQHLTPLFLLALTACDSDDGVRPPLQGAVRVDIVTEGAPADLDSDGYRLHVDAGAPQTVAPNASVIVEAAPGERMVTVGDVESNCAHAGESSRLVTVQAGQTAVVGFELACVPRVGSIRVAVTTTGQELDPDGYTLEIASYVDYGWEVLYSDRVDTNGELMLEGVPAGSREARLADVAANCVVTGRNPRSIELAHGATASVGFDIACAAPVHMEFTVGTLGEDPDANGYTISAAGAETVRTVAVPSSGTAALRDLPPGEYSVSLLGASLNCDAAGPNPRAIDARTGGTLQVAFEVACAPVRGFAFVSTADGDAEIYRAREDGGEATRLTDNAADDVDPAWSASAARIAFATDRDGDLEIYTMSEDGTGVTRLTQQPGVDRQPAWSPDGSRIAFVSERDGNAEIYSMAPDGSGLIRLTTNPTPDQDPVWSPDGAEIAFTRDSLIHVMAADGTDARPVTAYDGYYYSRRESGPDWSPDGSRIVFSITWCDTYYGTGDCAPPELYEVKPDGSGFTRFSAAASAATAPSWYPEGPKIAFATDECSTAYPGQCRRMIRALRLGVEMLDLIHDHAGSPAWRR